jgi:hypothetical protein
MSSGPLLLEDSFHCFSPPLSCISSALLTTVRCTPRTAQDSSTSFFRTNKASVRPYTFAHPATPDWPQCCEPSSFLYDCCFWKGYGSTQVTTVQSCNTVHETVQPPVDAGKSSVGPGWRDLSLRHTQPGRSTGTNPGGQQRVPHAGDCP